MASFEKRGNGVRAEVWLGGARKRQTFRNRTDAEKWATKMERDFDMAGIVPVKVEGTVGELIARYDRERFHKEKWGATKTYNLARLTKDIGAWQVRNMSKHKLMEYGILRATTGRKLGPAGLSSLFYCLKAVFETGHDLDWGNYRQALDAINDAMGALTRQEYCGQSNKRKRRIKRSEIERLKAYVAEHPSDIDFIAIMDLLSVLPIRVGELCRIKWTDIDREDRAVMLRQRKHPDHRIKERNDELVPLPVIDGYDTYEMLMNGPLSRTEAEGPFAYDRQDVSQEFSDLTRDAGIEDMHLHDFRAHGISFLLTKVEIAVTASISGHKDWATMAKHYWRPDIEDLHAAFRDAGVGRKVRHLRLAA